jgi:hypothetical protein
VEKLSRLKMEIHLELRSASITQPYDRASGFPVTGLEHPGIRIIRHSTQPRSECEKPDDHLTAN